MATRRGRDRRDTQQVAEHTLPEQLSEALQNIGLESIDHNVLNNIWAGATNESLPALEEAVAKVTDEFLSSLIEVLSSVDANQQYLSGILQQLSAKVDLKALVVLLRKIIEEDKVLGVLAATAYMKLLSIEEAQAFGLFNIFAIKSSLHWIRRWINSHRASGGSANKTESEQQNEDMDVDEEPVSAPAPSVDSELLGTKIDSVLHLLESIASMCDTVSMEHSPDAYTLAMEIATELSRFVANTQESEAAPKRMSGKGAGKISKDKYTKLNYSAIQQVWKLSYDIIKALTSPKHGPPEQTIATALKSVFPNVLSLFNPPISGAGVSKQVTGIRECAINFTRSLLEWARSQKFSIDAFQIFLQHVCVKIPEKAEYRHNGCKIICELLPELDSPNQQRFVTFLEKYARNQKTNFRLFAVELATQLLQNEVYVENADATFLRTLLQILVQRSSDKSANVRAKALACVANTCELATTYPNDSPLAKQIQHIFFAPANSSNSIPVLQLLRKRISDEKASVRKSAMQVLEMVGRLKLEGVELGDNDIRMLQERCLDPQVAIRKQALVSLSELLRAYPSSTRLRDAWVSSVLPLIFDMEQTVQEKVASYFHDLVIQPILDSHKSSKRSTKSTTEYDDVWQMLEVIDRAETQKAVTKICSQLASQGQLPNQLATALLNMLRSQPLKGAWILLAYCSPHFPKAIDSQFVLNYWNKSKDDKQDTSDNKLYALRVICASPESLKKADAQELAADLLARVKSFSYPPKYIQQFLLTIEATSGETKKQTPAWVADILADCDEALSEWILPAAGASIKHSSQKVNGTRAAPTIEQLDAYVFTVGELALRCTKGQLPRRLVTVIQTLAAPAEIRINIASPASESSNETLVPQSTRAHAFVALGKMCIEDSTLAKTCIPAFARELELSTSSAVRNNVMIVLCDLALRYTSLVETYMDKITLCLRDDSEMVRRQALMLITNLMQEGYIKLRNLLLFRIIRLLVDDSSAIRQYATFCLDTILAREGEAGKQVFYNKFIETIFYFNDYRLHPSYNQYPQSERDRRLFTLKGSGDAQKKRMELYKVFLGRLSEEQKFQLTGRLVHDVLAGVLDGDVKLDQGADVVADTLSILCCKEIKLRVAGIGVGKDEEVDDTSESAQKFIEAKGRILNKLVKKNMVENIIPIVTELKILLQSKHSPLLKDLMAYLADMMKEYKNEISEILAGDPRLARELEYDLRTGNLVTAKRQATFKSPAPRAPANSKSNQTPNTTNLNAKPVPRLKPTATPGAYVPSPAKRRVSSVQTEAQFRTPATPARRLSMEDGQLTNSVRRLSMASPALIRVRQADISAITSPSHSQVSRVLKFTDETSPASVEPEDHDESDSNDEEPEKLLQIRPRGASTKRKRDSDDGEASTTVAQGRPKRKKAKEASSPPPKTTRTRGAKRKAM